MIRRILTILGCVFFRPIGWLGWAALFLAVFAALHLLGWRDDTSILSGTLAPGGGDAVIVRGLTYTSSYFAAVLGSPILILAAFIYALLKRAWPLKATTS